MFEFKNNGKFLEVWGWDGFNGDDDILIGTIKEDTDGDYYWFHPAKEINLSCKMMRVISIKLSELNTNG